LVRPKSAATAALSAAVVHANSTQVTARTITGSALHEVLQIFVSYTHRLAVQRLTRRSA
jgi:hypothetical protein